LDLTVVPGLIEMPDQGSDEAILTDRALLEATDPDCIYVSTLWEERTCCGGEP